MKKRVRLRRRSDFQSAISGTRFHSGRALVGFAVSAGDERGRIGVTVSRGIKSAADRNRVRRRLREVARQRFLAGDASDSTRGAVGIRYDVVLIGRPAALEVSFADLAAEASAAALRLSRLNR